MRMDHMNDRSLQPTALDAILRETAGVGGFYFVDDLLPRPNWPAGHEPTVSTLIERLATHDQFVGTKLAWASGLMVLVRAR
jgi:hypothetical protein